MRVNSISTHLQLKKMSVLNQSAHVATTFQLLEISSITTSNQTISNIRTRYIFQSFLGKISAMKKNLEVPCKRDGFGYWNSCKRLPNFVNVAALASCNYCLNCYIVKNHQSCQQQRLLFKPTKKISVSSNGSEKLW